MGLVGLWNLRYCFTGWSSAVTVAAVDVVDVVEVRARRVGHVLFNESIVAVTHGYGPTEGLRSWSVDGKDVASAKEYGGAGSLWNLKFHCRCLLETREIPNCWTCE